MNALPNPLEEAREILFSQERERIVALQRAAGQFENQTRENLQALQEEAQRLKQELSAAETRLGQELESLRRAQDDLDALITRLTPAISGMVADSIRNSPEAMAEALGPVMGEAIRVQIRDSRQEMVEAIYPIIGETIQKALAEFTRELQRNIDARLKTSLSPLDFLRLAWARLRGVPASRLTLRDALPFAVRQLFLVHRQSGLLLAHSHPDQVAATDADLVSSMLTAIRDFVRDSYGSGQGEEELDEIQYGGQRIILVTGSQAYLAAVIEGIEPQGFRAALRDFLTDLHLREARALREYSGNLADFAPASTRLRNLLQAASPRQDSAPRPLSRAQKGILAFASAGLLLFLALSCFYLQFTLALLPLAFPPPSLTPTQTFTLTPSPTLTATLTPSLTPTFTPRPSATFTLTPATTFTLLGNVWLRSGPGAEYPVLLALSQGEQVQRLQTQGEWSLVLWRNTQGQAVQGWLPSLWLQTP